LGIFKRAITWDGDKAIFGTPDPEAAARALRAQAVQAARAAV